MTKYIVKRLLFAMLVLWAVSMIVFGAVRIIPGDVCHLVLGTPDIDQKQCDLINEELGLNEPVYKQYVTYMSGVLRGDFGKSLQSKRDVWENIRRRIPVTVELTVMATVLAITLAIPMGIIMAMNRDRPADYVLRLISVGWLSIPGLWIASMLIIYPAKWWGYSPPVGYVNIWVDPLKNLEQMFMPAISIGLALSASLSRFMRSSMLDVLRQDYVRTARAKGLRERTVVFQHTLKNAMIPVITLFAIQVGALLGGTVVAESIFSLPGLGTLMLSSVQYKDYTQVQGLVLFFSTILVGITLLVDISYAWFDPRIKYA